MKKSRYSTAQKELQESLKQARIDAGMRQIDLAKILERPQSFVSKYESGERLLDILEPTQQTVDSLMKLDLAAGVDVEIKL